MPPRSRPRVALVHDWLVCVRGAERVLEVFAELLPDADLFTLVHKKGSLTPALEARRIHTSFLQRMPLGVSHYRHYLPLMPAAIESHDLSGYDFVLSSSYCVSKGVITRPDARHVSYCHTPIRYAWEQQHEYFGPGRAGPLVRAVAALATSYLRTWDEASARRVDRYVANSRHVAARVLKRYGAASEVIYPPVDCGRFRVPADPGGGGYYVMLGAFAPYKRVDLAIEAFERMGRRLLIGGGGQEAEKLRRRVRPGGPVELVGHVPDERLPEFLGRARAFVFPGEEDFGIAPVEAQACGVPILALGRGGALESVVGLDDPRGAAPTGVFFEEQSADALIEAVEFFERRSAAFDPRAIRQHALRFDRPRFVAEIRALLAEEGVLEAPAAAAAG
jgi:glycosyltransferase involved in cell wall biosynthesis